MMPAVHIMSGRAIGLAELIERKLPDDIPHRDWLADDLATEVEEYVETTLDAWLASRGRES